MYCNPCDDYAGLGSHLGQIPIGYISGGGGTGHPCEDFMYRLMNQANCAAAGYNGVAAAPPPPPPEPIVYEPQIIVEPAPRPLPQPPAPIETFVQETEPIEELVALEPSSSVITVPGGGGGWGPDSPAAQLSVGGTEVFVEAEEEGPGFGIVEVALAAGVAWVLSQSYRRRKR